MGYILTRLQDSREIRHGKRIVRLFYIAKGSLAELRTQIQIAYSKPYRP